MSIITPLLCDTICQRLAYGVFAPAKLSSREIRKIARHLIDCPDCRAVFVLLSKDMVGSCQDQDVTIVSRVAEEVHRALRQQIQSYTRILLSAPDQVEIAYSCLVRHLTSCEVCRRDVEETREVLETLAEIANEGTISMRRSSTTRQLCVSPGIPSQGSAQTSHGEKTSLASFCTPESQVQHLDAVAHESGLLRIWRTGAPQIDRSKLQRPRVSWKGGSISLEYPRNRASA